MRVTRYRYRTPVLTGRWRESREAALHDAITARQAIVDETEPGGLRWLVPGEVEEDAGVNSPVSRH